MMEKVRRKSYSFADLRLRAAARDELRNAGIRESLHEELPEEEDFRLWDIERAREAGMPFAKLPSEARLVGFGELALELAKDPRGYCLLSGAERGAAGLEAFRMMDYWDKTIGHAFSFCVNGRTYCAFENPDDNFRSSMGALIEREGNHCETVFEPVALIPRFCVLQPWNGDDQPPLVFAPDHEKAPSSHILELIDPISANPAIAVGTSRADDYYPSFVGHFDPKALERARSAGVALAHILEEEIQVSSLENPPKRRL